MTDPTATSRYRRSLIALALVPASPFLAWSIIDPLLSSLSCGFGCVFYTLLGMLLGWSAGVALAVTGLRRGEMVRLAWTAIVLNAIPATALILGYLLLVLG